MSRIILKTLAVDARNYINSLVSGSRIVLKTQFNDRIFLNTEVKEVGSAPVNTVNPETLPFDIYVGAVAVVDSGTWSGTTPITYTYQWYQTDGLADFPIVGATSNIYTVTSGDFGYNLFANVTATNVYGSANIDSIQTGIVIEPEAPVNTVAPVILGSVVVGQTLTLTSIGTWTGIPTPTYTYQWISDGSYIAGQTGSTYLVVSGDETAEFRCIVFATNIAGSVIATSNTLSGAEIPVNTVAPTITGTVRMGQVLSSTQGTWTGTPTPTITYQWQRGGVDISGATSSTYTVVSADISEELSCSVTATNVAGAATEDTNVLVNKWRDILLMAPEFVWAFSDQPALTIGDPVPALIDPYGTTITSTMLTTQQATYQADAIRFDGIDDRYTLATPSSLASLAALDRTGSLIIAHSTDYTFVGGPADKMWFGAGAATNSGSRVCLAYTRRDTFLSLNRSIQFYDASIQRNFNTTTGLASTAVCHIETYSTSGVGKNLLTVAGRTDETGVAITGQTIAPTIVAIGAGVNAGAAAFYRNGDLRFIAHFGRILTSTEIDTIRTVMIANGAVV